VRRLGRWRPGVLSRRRLAERLAYHGQSGAIAFRVSGSDRCATTGRLERCADCSASTGVAQAVGAGVPSADRLHQGLHHLLNEERVALGACVEDRGSAATLDLAELVAQEGGIARDRAAGAVAGGSRSAASSELILGTEGDERRSRVAGKLSTSSRDRRRWRRRTSAGPRAGSP